MLNDEQNQWPWVSYEVLGFWILSGKDLHKLQITSFIAKYGTSNYRLIQCEIKGEYIPEDKFELLDWYPRAKAARKRERLIPSTTRIKIHSSSSGVDFIKELVKLAGGTVVENDQEADIIICDKTKMLNDKRMVTDHWLFESIEHWKCKSINLRVCQNY